MIYDNEQIAEAIVSPSPQGKLSPHMPYLNHGRPYFMSHLLSHSLFHYFLLYSNTIKTTPQNSTITEPIRNGHKP